MSNKKSSRQSKSVDHVNLHIRLDVVTFGHLKRLSMHKGWSMSLLANDIIKNHFEKSCGDKDGD
jgi:hypothetical protein